MSIEDFAPGSLFAERYRITKPTRQGGMSVAFEVTDEREGAQREMQVFPSGLFESDEQAEDLLNQLEPWKQVESAHVVRVHDICRHGPASLVMVTDCPAGPSLRERLNAERRLTTDEGVRVGCQLLEGLAAVHAKDLVHGDIKPYTVHDSGDQALLIDGGITPGLWSVKHLGDKTALIGTPYYAPVEQFGGDSPDVRSDIYNLAAVLFESITGVLPWPGSTFLEIFQAKISKDPPSMKALAPEVDVAPELEQTIVRGCHANRHERYGTADEFRDALQRFA